MGSLFCRRRRRPLALALESTEHNKDLLLLRLLLLLLLLPLFFLFFFFLIFSSFDFFLLSFPVFTRLARATREHPK